jgi:TRAP-type C4-dicarboxylate transport system permease small subunit
MRTLVEIVNRAADVLAQILLGVMVVVVFVQVIFRFFIQQPLSWSEEVARYVFVWIIWMGAAVAVKHGAHPGMDLLTKGFAPRWQRVTEVAMGLLYALTLLTVVVTGFALVYANMSQPSPAMELPMGIPYAAIPVAAVIMLLNLICTIFFPKKGARGHQVEVDKWASG